MTEITRKLVQQLAEEGNHFLAWSWLERDQAARDAEAKVAALVSALERTEANFRSAVNGRPVRDMSENLAENCAALGGDHEQPHENHCPGCAALLPCDRIDHAITCPARSGGDHEQPQPPWPSTAITELARMIGDGCSVEVGGWKMTAQRVDTYGNPLHEQPAP